MDDLFSQLAAWSGGYYELEVRIGPRCSERLRATMKSIWNAPGIEGCYLRNDLPRADQPRFEPDDIDLEAEEHLYGVATLPDGNVLPCGTFPLASETECDRVDFYFPTGCLSLAYPEVECFPLGDFPPTRVWREPLDAWLAELAKAVYRQADFEGACIVLEGCEPEVSEVEVPAAEKRKWGVLLPREGHLVYYPANIWEY